MDEHARWVLLDAVRSGGPEICEAALMLLLARGNVKPQEEWIVREVLYEEEWYLRRLALKVLARTKGVPDLPPVLEAGVDPNPYLRASAIEFLGSVKDRGARHVLPNALRDPVASVRRAAISALPAPLPSEAFPLLIRLSSDPLTGHHAFWKLVDSGALATEYVLEALERGQVDRKHAGRLLERLPFV